MRIPKILHYIWVLPILFAFSMPKAYAVDITAEFTDANFLTCVSTALGTPGSVDSVAAAALGVLTCHHTSIASIAGADNLTGLVNLTLNNNSISDLTPLTGITGITYMDLSYNSITNITPLSGFSNLISVNLNNNNISSLTPLSGLTTNLLGIQASNNSGITNIAVLAGLPNLQVVTLHYTGIDDADLAYLEGLTNLTALSIAGNGITDISGFDGLTNIVNFYAENNAITDISVLSGMTGMGRLYLNDNAGLSDISYLSSLTSIWDLHLEDTAITSVNALSGLTGMDTLDISGNDLTDISALSGMDDLRWLHMSQNNIGSISALSGKTGLMFFVADSNANLSDISPLEDSTLMQQFSAHSCNISDISVLSYMTVLESLNLYGNSFTDLTPLQDLTSLIATQINGNSSITDLSPLNDGLNGPGSTCDPGAGSCACVNCFSDNNYIRITGDSGLLGLNSVEALEQIDILNDSSGTTVEHEVTTDVSSFFEDDIFLACASLALGTSGSVDVEDAIALTGTLDCSSLGINYVNGVEFFTSISTLDLHSNYVNTDLGGLGSLSNLTTLILNNNRVKNLDELTGLTSLTSLDLAYNELDATSNIGALTGSTSLGTLSVQNNTLTNLDGIGTYTSLTTLNAQNNSITDISDLGLADSLVTINLSNNTGIATNLSAASWGDLTNLTSLNLYNTGLSDLAPLGSDNTNIDGFSSFNTIDVRGNAALSLPANYAAALDEVDLIEAAGAPNNGVVLYDINYEDCDNSIDDDGDGDIDAADDYCTVSFYVDYDTGGSTECTLADPCNTISRVFSRTAFDDKIGLTGVVINIYVQGSREGSESLSQSGVVADINIQPWGSTPSNRSMTISADNVTLEGFEISNAATNMGIVIAGNNGIIRDNYVHDTFIGIIAYDPMSTGVSNNKIYNNVLYDNTDNTDYCGGILIINANNTEVFNNTVYNNCSGTLPLGYADITLTSFPAYGMPAPQNSIVKQNIVYNTIGGTKYYYDIGTESVNGASPGSLITDAVAAAFGTGNNFIAASDPFDDSSATASYSAVSTGFGLSASTYEDYQIGSMAVGTPALDFLDVARPTGTGEAGAFEYEDGGGGGGGCGDPGNPDDAGICVAGVVQGGIAITAGSDVIIDVDPANGQPSDDTATKTGATTTDGNELTVWNNEDAGFDVTVALVGGDTGTTANTLGIAATATTLAGAGTPGTIKFLSVENAGAGETSLGGGTDVDAYTAYTTGMDVYSNDNTTDGVCTAGTISVDHELVANSTVLPGTYTGTATYTIAVHV